MPRIFDNIEQDLLPALQQTPEVAGRVYAARARFLPQGAGETAPWEKKKSRFLSSGGPKVAKSATMGGTGNSTVGSA
jgi:hypothetical protein